MWSFFFWIHANLDKNAKVWYIYHIFVKKYRSALAPAPMEYYKCASSYSSFAQCGRPAPQSISAQGRSTQLHPAPIVAPQLLDKCASAWYADAECGRACEKVYFNALKR